MILAYLLLDGRNIVRDIGSLEEMWRECLPGEQVWWIARDEKGRFDYFPSLGSRPLR